MLGYNLGFKKKIDLKHVAVSLEANALDRGYAESHGITLEEVYSGRDKKIKWLVETQAKLGLPILTIYLLSEEREDAVQFSAIVDSLMGMFDWLKKEPLIHNNQIKISVLGKWYDLPGRLVEKIKEAIESTKDYDNFFLNLCINYDGQEEIVDACRLIVMKARAERLDIGSIKREIIKENIYSSYFPPPDIIIKNGSKRISSLLLWDSVGSIVHFTGKQWQDFELNDFTEALRKI